MYIALSDDKTISHENAKKFIASFASRFSIDNPLTVNLDTQKLRDKEYISNMSKYYYTNIIYYREGLPWQIQDKQKARLSEIIQKVNDLFEGQLSADDKLQFVQMLKTKMLENSALQQQAQSNAEPQFQNSPDLRPAMLDAIIDASDAQQTMSTQAINSEKLREALLDILLGPGQLYAALKAQNMPTQSPPSR